MRQSLVWMLGMIPALASAGPSAPMNWSPDGHWVAYTVAAPAKPTELASGWLFDRPGDVAGRVGEVADSPSVYRIYAADSESGTSVLLEESRDPLTSPAWSPDGRALAFGRVVDEGMAQARYEVIVQDAPGQDRVLLSHPFGKTPTGRTDWTAEAPVWSPDGRYLAIHVPRATPSFNVVQVGNGRVVKSIEGGAPCWSPDGTRLAFVRVERTASLLVIDIGSRPAENVGTPAGMDLTFGAPRHLVDLGQITQSPVWSRDGKSILAVARRVVVRNAGPSLQVDLLRARVDSGSVETVARLAADLIEQDRTFRGVALSHDRDVDEMFYTLSVESQPETIVWARPKKPETVDRFNPLNFSVRVNSLSFSPNARTLAIRFGDRGDGSTAALYDVWSHRLTLLATDDPSRREWVSLLIATADRLLRAILPPAAAGGQPLTRPTILPVPGEIAANHHEALVRLRKLGRLGGPLCEPIRGGEGDTVPGTTEIEARLFFDALREDYPAALKALEALEARTESPDRLERLLALRAQLFLGLGDIDRSTDTIEFLGSIEAATVSRLETSPAGTTLTAEPIATNHWARYLAARLDDLARSSAGKGTREEDAARELNPAGPLQGVPFDRLPNGVFIGPRNGPPLPPPVVEDAPDVRVRIARPRPIPVLPPDRRLSPFPFH